MVDGPAPGGTTVAVVRVTDTHAPALAEFYRAVWDAGATPESVRRARAAAAAANPLAPGADVPTFVFLQGGRVLGHVTTIPARLWIAGVERPAHWLKGLMVLPEHRNGPVGMLVLKEAVRQLDTTMALVVQAAPRRLYAALGFADLGAIPNFAKLLRPARVVARLAPDAVAAAGAGRLVAASLRLAQRSGLAAVAGALAGAATRGWAALAGRRPGGAATTPTPWRELPTADVNALWAQVRTRFDAAGCRDAAALRWRYGGAPDESPVYHLVTGRARDGATLTGLAVVRVAGTQADPRLGGVRVATLADLLYPPDRPEAGLAVLHAAEAVAREADADVLLCSASHRAVWPLLRRRAFLRAGANVHFVIRDPAPGTSPPGDLGGWWLTRGDASADEVF
jgi:hypothetical protein